MTPIKLNRGQTLGILVTPEDAEGDPVVMDETWDVAAAIAPVTATSGEVAIAAEVQDGKALVTHDTVDLPAATYLIDVRLTNPESRDQWTEKIRLTLNEPVTKPSARPEPEPEPEP
jgi:hypothetical protein